MGIAFGRGCLIGMEGIDVREEELGGWLEADVSFLFFFSLVDFLLDGVARSLVGVARPRFGAMRWRLCMSGRTCNLLWRLKRSASPIRLTFR